MFSQVVFIGSKAWSAKSGKMRSLSHAATVFRPLTNVNWKAEKGLDGPPCLVSDCISEASAPETT